MAIKLDGWTKVMVDLRHQDGGIWCRAFCYYARLQTAHLVQVVPSWRRFEWSYDPEQGGSSIRVITDERIPETTHRTSRFLIKAASLVEMKLRAATRQCRSVRCSGPPHTSRQSTFLSLIGRYKCQVAIRTWCCRLRTALQDRFVFFVTIYCRRVIARCYRVPILLVR